MPPLNAALLAVLVSAAPVVAKPAQRHPARHAVPAAAAVDAPPPIPQTPYDACDYAIAAAEKPPHLPDKLLPAISRVESGRLDPTTRRVRAWPWTINVEGVGSFFDTKEQAVATVQALQAKGVRSIDVGCMQVNLMHHPKAFASLDEAFEPKTNTAYAAGFLAMLHRQFNDWNLATAAYHSMDPVRGEEYQRLVLGRVMTPMGAGGSGLGGTALALKGIGPYSIWPPPGASYAALPPVNFAFGAFGSGIGPSSVLINPLPSRVRVSKVKGLQLGLQPGLLSFR